MRLKIDHETIYRYSAPVTRSVQSLRLTPRSDKRQRILEWPLPLPGTATEFTDAFGNVTHLLTMENPHEEIRIGGGSVGGSIWLAQLRCFERPSGRRPPPPGGRTGVF